MDEDDRLPLKTLTKESESHSTECFDMSVLIREAMNLSSSSEQCGGQSVSGSFVPSDAVSNIIKDEAECSDAEACSSDETECSDIDAVYNVIKDATEHCTDAETGNSNDVIITQHIDSVFVACDPAGMGMVAVADVIAYLRDTLHVSTSW